MRRWQGVCSVVLASVAAMGVGAADAGKLVWKFQQDDRSASIAVVNARDVDNPEADYPFYMECTAEGDDTTIVSDVDAKALGKAIAAGSVPSFWYVLDGKKHDETGGEIGDIRYDQMAGEWQYIVYGANPDMLLTATTAKVAGTGVNLDLPTDKFRKSIMAFKAACEKLQADLERQGESK